LILKRKISDRAWFLKSPNKARQTTFDDVDFDLLMKKHMQLGS
jgi:hypothetical protein